MGRPATDCDILGYPRPRKRGIIPGYKDLVKRATPRDRIYCFTICWTSGPWERDLSRSVLRIACASTSRYKYIIVVTRKERSPKMVAEER